MLMKVHTSKTKGDKKKKFNLRGWGTVKKVFKFDGTEIKSKLKRLRISIIEEYRN